MVQLTAPPPDATVYRTSVLLPDGLRFPVAPTVGGVGRLALSPDGRRLAFVATDPSGNQMLWVRPLGALTATMLSGTEGANSPFWSADSRHIAFVATPGILKRVDANGLTAPVTLGFAFATTGAWGADDTILFTPSAGSPLHAMPATGGAARPVTTLDAAAGDILHRSPVFLPGGRQFLYVAVSGRDGETTAARAVLAGSLDDPDMNRPVLPGGVNVQYAGGHLIFLRQNVLVAQPFDARRLALTGPATPITEEVELVGSRSAAFTASSNGLLAYQPATDEGTQLRWLEREGTLGPMVGEAGNHGYLSLSPDGRRAAVSLLNVGSNTRDIWIVDLVRGVRTRFTSHPADEVAPAWSPDGTQIAYASSRLGHFDVYVKPASGVGNERLVYADDLEKYPTDWTPEGDAILYTGFDATRRDLFRVSLDEDPAPERLLSLAGDARVSPDGDWLLYDSVESGRLEVYVAPYPQLSGREQVSSGGGSAPRWAGDREIVYAGRDNFLMAVGVEFSRGDLRVGTPRQLLQARPAGPGAFFDVTPDGGRILLNTLRSEMPPAITLVQNWRALLTP
jgi:eukaryotic-like serine/threonine-protein kinase